MAARALCRASPLWYTWRPLAPGLVADVPKQRTLHNAGVQREEKIHGLVVLVLQVVLALGLSVAVAAVAWWRGSLSRSGAASAVVVGTLTIGLGGWRWGVLLAVFFVSSTLLSHYKEAEKAVAAEKFAKGHRRDFGQVLANGGLGALLALANVVAPAAHWFIFFTGVMATVTADTWATELGTLSRRPPHLITSGRVVEVGSSGGVSWLGTAVSLLGGLTIGLCAGLITPFGLLPVVILGAVGGLAGSLFDSLLGATVQRIYYCDICQKETERRVHQGEHQTRPLRGWSWLDNDLVNLFASIFGGAITLALAWLALA